MLQVFHSLIPFYFIYLNIVFITFCPLKGKSFSSVLNRLMNASLRFVEEKPNQLVAALALDTIRNVIDHEPSVASVFCDRLLALVHMVGVIGSIEQLRQEHSKVRHVFFLNIV